ncbi:MULTISPECIES: biotin--[acetyl-CoA-carboxylase] ligase [Asaia]|uniref:biotin--[acetyl-CoA-carboxylase] ligase n=1 Tax=Asaia TaxID=91914 RepID=UPI002FC397A4
MSFPWSLTCYETLGSTSDFCKQQADQGAPNGMAVLAHLQTAGRGTRGRAWTAPQGNLSFSFLLRHERIEALILAMPFLVAVAVHEALSFWLPDSGLRLKWPNDVVCEGAKLCGVLIERGGTPQDSWTVTGIGVNLRTAPLIEGRRTVSAAALGAQIGAEDLARRILEQFGLWLDRWERGGFEPIRIAWLDRAHEPGSRLAVQRGPDYIEGFFAGLDAGGRLLLQTVQGEIQTFAAGDILLLG